jgi:flavin reductase (DIM6/NTAB) family NADH-FMN oxidoreductase RutF
MTSSMTCAGILDDALAYFDCELTEHYSAGDHELVFGRVVDGRIIDPSAVPMTYRETGDMDKSSTLYPARF